MFYYIEGTVTHMEAQLAVVDCGGVGYALRTTNNTLSRLKSGERARLYTYLHVREDIFDLYGFYSQSERSSFEMLIGISGVGPKAALSILSSSTPEALALAIISGDDKALTVAQGIGKKIASRIILELKDKLAKETADMDFGPGISPPKSGGKLGDAVSALTVLGYGRAEIAEALKDIDDENMGVEEIIKAALRRMAVK